MLVFGGGGWRPSRGPWPAQGAEVASPRLGGGVGGEEPGAAGKESGKGVLQVPGELGLKRAVKRWTVVGVPRPQAQGPWRGRMLGRRGVLSWKPSRECGLGSRQAGMGAQELSLVLRAAFAVEIQAQEGSAPRGDQPAQGCPLQGSGAWRPGIRAAGN